METSPDVMEQPQDDPSRPIDPIPENSQHLGMEPTMHLDGDLKPLDDEPASQEENIPQFREKDERIESQEQRGEVAKEEDALKTELEDINKDVKRELKDVCEDARKDPVDVNKDVRKEVNVDEITSSDQVRIASKPIENFTPVPKGFRSSSPKIEKQETLVKDSSQMGLAPIKSPQKRKEKDTKGKREEKENKPQVMSKPPAKHEEQLRGFTDLQDLPVQSKNRPRGSINKPFLNIVVIGHVDAGKSTLIGHLSLLCKGVDKETINRLAREADLAGKTSFKYAWVMDKLKAERQRGISIDTKFRRMETRSSYVVLIDTPGHRDYVHNMVTGTSQADTALLVVSAERGEFEAGLKGTGQTREHLHIAYSMGVKQLIVLVNKMETTSPPFSEVRFSNIVGLIKPFARRVGYDEDSVIYIPASAYEGDNLAKRSSRIPWYRGWNISRKSGTYSGSWSGHTLLDAIEQLEAPTRMSYRSLRVPIHTVYKFGDGGIVAAGRIHTGSIKENADVVFAPSSTKAKVNAVQMYRETMTDAISGDNIGLQIQHLSIKDVRKGDVCGDLIEDPPCKVEKFTAQILVLNHPGAIKKGYTPLLFAHTASVACKFVDILERTDRRTGEKIEDHPEDLCAGEVGVVEMLPLKPVSLECFFDYPTLGRVVFRDLKQTVAIGVVIKVTKSSLATDNDKLTLQQKLSLFANEDDPQAKENELDPKGQSSPRKIKKNSTTKLESKQPQKKPQNVKKK